MGGKQKTSYPGMIEPDILAQAGRALYGEQWYASLARALKVPERRMRRWLNDGCPPDIALPLRALLRERHGDIQRISQTLETAETDLRAQEVQTP